VFEVHTFKPPFVPHSSGTFINSGRLMKTEVIVLIGVIVAIGLAISFVRTPRAAAEEGTSLTTVFVFVKITESIMPIDRGEKYEDPLNASLKREGLGEVTGGGSQLSEPDAEGRRTVEWVGLDIELTDLERGLPFLKGELLRLGAPAQTTLEFKRAASQVTESVAE
jgi:hypothetical protein